MVFRVFDARMRVIAAGVAVALSASSMPAPGASAAVESSGHLPGVVDVDHAEAEAEAREVARAFGHSVVVDSQTSPTVLVTAEPDGSMQLRGSIVPERARVDSVWMNLDHTLRMAGQWWEPKVASVPVRISAGGSDELVQVRSESGDWVSERWTYGPPGTTGEFIANEISGHYWQNWTPAARQQFRDVMADYGFRVR